MWLLCHLLIDRDVSSPMFLPHLLWWATSYVKCTTCLMSLDFLFKLMPSLNLFFTWQLKFSVAILNWSLLKVDFPYVHLIMSTIKQTGPQDFQTQTLSLCFLFQVENPTWKFSLLFKTSQNTTQKRTEHCVFNFRTLCSTLQSSKKHLTS